MHNNVQPIYSLSKSTAFTFIWKWWRPFANGFKISCTWLSSRWWVLVRSLFCRHLFVGLLHHQIIPVVNWRTPSGTTCWTNSVLSLSWIFGYLFMSPCAPHVIWMCACCSGMKGQQGDPLEAITDRLASGYEHECTSKSHAHACVGMIGARQVHIHLTFLLNERNV